MNEDYTAGILSGIPLFCVNRKYEKYDAWKDTIQYTFTFSNRYGASILCSKYFIGYELAIIKLSGNHYEVDHSTGIADDMVRGTSMEMHKLLCRIEQL